MKRLDKIESDRAEVKDTATIDLEWNIKESRTYQDQDLRSVLLY